LLEAESEAQAAYDARKAEEAAATADSSSSGASASAAASSATSLIAEFDQEAKAWEERTRKLLQSRGGHEVVDTGSLPSSGSNGHVEVDRSGGADVLVIGAEEVISEEITPASPVTDICPTIVLEEDIVEVPEVENISPDAVPEEDVGVRGWHAEEESQIAAALRSAGLQPGLEAAQAFKLAISETDVQDTEVSEDGDGTTGGKIQWAMPARQWAAKRLRRKREQGLRSRAGTPCGSAPTSPAAQAEG
jgi:hypothetical protein